MTTHIALLRGINVGGANRLAMADLRAVAARAGLGAPRTLLQSGNLVFSAEEAKGAALERRLEAAIAAELGLTLDVVVRTADAWSDMVAANPFPAEAARDPARLAVLALKTAPDPAAGARLRAAIRGPETARVIGREAFVIYPDGMGQSRLTPAIIDRALGVRGTARNWNTVLKVAAMAGG